MDARRRTTASHSRSWKRAHTGKDQKRRIQATRSTRADVPFRLGGRNVLLFHTRSAANLTISRDDEFLAECGSQISVGSCRRGAQEADPVGLLNRAQRAVVIATEAERP